MADEESLYLDNLDEFINDQDKVVTYKWLSRTLSVSSNTAKQMLYAFLLKEREKKGNSLTATYLVGGRLKVDDQSVHQYVLTSDDKLEETKKLFDCVTSVHVYSLQKKTPKDINTLYAVDYEIHQEHKEEPNKWSHIYCKEAIKLSDGGVSRGTSKGKPGKENAVPKAEMTSGLGSSSSVADKSKPKPSNQKPKKGQLPSMGMFGVKTEKKPEQPKPDEPVTAKNEKPAKPVEKSKPSGMMSFFGKQISEPAKSKPEPQEKPKEKVEKKLEEKPPKKVEEKLKNEKSEEKKPDTKIKETPENKQKSNKPTKQIRKRIKNLSSSDEEEDPVPKSLKKLVSDSESEEEIKPRRSKSKNKKEKETEVVEKKRKTKKETTKRDKEVILDESKDKKTKTNRKRKKEQKEESSEEESINSKSDSTVISETPNPSQRPPESSTKRRKRRKVLKSKTYVDDDGFMVTEKVFESESTDASDEEPVIDAKQHPLPEPLSANSTSPDSKLKKHMDLKPVKQASLMSFFKKN